MVILFPALAMPVIGFMGLNNSDIYRLILYFGSFILCYWALLGLDFERFIKPSKVKEAQLLCVLLAMGLAYLVVSFLLSIQII